MSFSAQKRERLPQAPRAPLPELAEFLAPLRVHLSIGGTSTLLNNALLSAHYEALRLPAAPPAPLPFLRRTVPPCALGFVPAAARRNS
jgi:hypothetical protein